MQLFKFLIKALIMTGITGLLNKGGLKIRAYSKHVMKMADVSYKIGFMFPGQGAQTVGMGVALCNEIPAAKELFDKASTILGYDLLAKCRDGPKEELDSTVISQPAIFVSSMVGNYTACMIKIFTHI